MSLLTANINAMNKQIGNIQANLNIISSNTFSNYNQLTEIMTKQSSIYNPIYYSSGNIICENLLARNSYIINGTLLFSNIATYSGNLNMTNGNITNTIGNVLLSNGNIRSTVGNLVMSNGNINSTIGNITTSNGNLILTRGNIILSNGDANISGNLYLEGLATILGQSGFKVDYGRTTTATTSVTITFNTSFSTTPTVIATGQRDSSTPSTVYVTVISTTGVTLVSRDTAGTGVIAFFSWIAIGT